MGLLHFELSPQCCTGGHSRAPFIPKFLKFNFFSNSLLHLQLRRALVLGKGRKILDNTLTHVNMLTL